MSEKGGRDQAGADESSELRKRIAQLERDNRRLRERCEDAELKIVQLEGSVKSMENTLSFRLGHALIQSTKSLNGLKALPLVLAELRQDTRRRKAGDADEHNLLGAALRASAGYASRVAKRGSTRTPKATTKTKAKSGR
jgi:hypothetical protein